MSVLIKGMEMPEAGQEIIIAENWDGTIYARLEPSEGGWYPVVEVPTPHGRLIDADALHKDMYSRAFETDGDTMWQSGCWVRYRAIEQVQNAAPTVIEAEEYKNGDS